MGLQSGVLGKLSLSAQEGLWLQAMGFRLAPCGELVLRYAVAAPARDWRPFLVQVIQNRCYGSHV
jgi:hypothetical protein